MQFELRRFLREGEAGNDNQMIDWVRWRAVLCAVVLVVGAVGSVPVTVASADSNTDSVDSDENNEAPLADAGLDQEVPVNATVYLDASGSRDPDGSIASYEWSIERPDGTPTSPRCDTCPQSEFQAGMVGTYAVTVTVMDSDGATSSDTLYVEVSDAEGPSVELSGPTSVTAGTTVTFEATAEAGEEPLLRIDWARNGSEIADDDVRGESAADRLEPDLEPGTYEMSAEIVSELGRTDTARLVVEVTPNVSQRGTQPCPEAIWNATTKTWDTSGCDLGNLSGGTGESPNNACSRYDREDEFYCNNDRLMYGNPENIIIHDADGDGEVTVNGQTLDVENSSNGMGRSYRMTRAEFKEKFGVDTVQTLDSQQGEQIGDIGDVDTLSESNDDQQNNNSDDEAGTNVNECQYVPKEYTEGCTD
jgi:hypothetical protein